MSTGSTRHILLTGPPGIGKTTIIQKVCQDLKHRNISMKGFYTSELRESGRRVGFDIISLDGTVKPLARVGDGVGPKVGNYTVQVQSFESVALPILQTSVVTDLTVIDEIGKMELFSKSFELAIRKIFSSDDIILGTIPLLKGKPIQLVEYIRAHPSVTLTTVDLKNRDHLVFDIVSHVVSLVSGKKRQDM